MLPGSFSQWISVGASRVAETGKTFPKFTVLEPYFSCETQNFDELVKNQSLPNISLIY